MCRDPRRGLILDWIDFCLQDDVNPGYSFMRGCFGWKMKGKPGNVLGIWHVIDDLTCDKMLSKGITSRRR